jgi:hypothetical protein
MCGLCTKKLEGKAEAFKRVTTLQWEGKPSRRGCIPEIATEQIAPIGGRTSSLGGRTLDWRENLPVSRKRVGINPAPVGVWQS